ncbi:hypothetical protein QR680_014918 [Steinernema hermaphroditum]|uniref:BPTI/Kunitz inhibitor domain-containing protein n=1 Tax=Steinernema hermaphroditum TaxID=289476 RepID=A0AA39M412_9BILA|nr:hypothetical protein QR680_014918 [Steinernema hermaphroditum]
MSLGARLSAEANGFNSYFGHFCRVDKILASMGKSELAVMVNLQQQFPQSNYAPSADGVCCPSRALACIQPQVTGPNSSEPRWWYNSVTGTCQQFLWDPSATMSKHHSANNFRTIDHCESYCRDTCARGSPQYSIEAQVYLERAVTGCSNSVSCANDFQCNSVGSQHLCCPTPASVCSAKGARPMDLHPRSTVFHAGFMTTTGRESVRFYYDHNTGKCSDFIYKGAGGNFNNFLSKHECEMFCARLQCDRGTPLRIGEDSQRCQSNAGCPSSHECKTDQGVCCPRKQTICSQPLRVGDCTENVKRYWYNAATRQCQMFEYTGCQGNDNNFENILDCQSFCKNAIPEPRCVQGQAYKDTFGNFVQCAHGMTKCPANYECYFDGSMWGCCPTKSYTCSLNSDSGIQCGAGSTFKYFYNSHTQSCETFQYNGCDGNSNNFASRETCEEYCGVGGCPNGGLPMRDHSGQMISCSSQEGCPSTHECSSVFVSMATVNRCCPTKSYICSLPPLQGTSCGSHHLTRYYFNIVTAQCSSFQYNGCDGNQNNFVSMTQCNNFCMSSACPAGTTVYLDPNDNKPILCNEALKNSCPPNYECTFNGLLNNYVCCGSSDMGVCPDGERAFVNSADHSAKECMINVEGSCPSNYLCRFNLQRNKYYCCASVKGHTCPAGKFLYKESRSGNPKRCTVGKEQCPDGYSCQSYLKNAFQGFCCSANMICPDNGEFLVDESSHQPRICTMGSFVNCPNGYTCRSVHNSNEGFCCRGTTVSVTDGCPPGNFVYMVKNEIANCDPFNPPNAPCPAGYTCQWSTANQRYQCCGSKPLPPPEKKKDGCPNDQIAFLEKDVVRTCSAGGKTCPIGYFCQFSAINNQFQCCGVSAGCPNDQVAFVSVKGEPEKCAMGQSNCPIGYSCQKTAAGHAVCCTSRLTQEDCNEEQILVDGECLKKASPNDNCTSSAQCMGGSICSGEKCACPGGTRLVGKFCQVIPTCMEGQILKGNMCHNKVRIGESCKIKEQCPEGSGCEKGVCSCPKGQIEKNGKCVEKQTKPSAPRGAVVSRPKSLISKCLNPAMVAYRDFLTDRVQFCSARSKPCPPGFSCQPNAIKQQYICCGPQGARKIVSQLNVKGASGNPHDVCPAGRIPYLLNGLPQKCTKSRCAQGYQCVFSGQDYYCCSVAKNMAPTSSEDANQCSRGLPLIYPRTNTPVTCSPLRKACPRGYMCEMSLTTKNYICCSVRLMDEQLPNGCPEELVQVTRIEDNESVTRCERTCPPNEVAIGGICQKIIE